MADLVFENVCILHTTCTMYTCETAHASFSHTLLALHRAESITSDRTLKNNAGGAMENTRENIYSSSTHGVTRHVEAEGDHRQGGLDA